MIWFNGSIAEAVQTSKTRNAIFVVYVEGQDENSKQMTDMINHPDAVQKLGSSDFVAVKLDAGSESYNQFVQIYQLVPVPSLFFIGKNGTPIEVIPQRLEHNDFLSKINNIIDKSGYKNLASGVAQKTANLIRSEIGESAKTTNTPENTTKTDIPNSAPVKANEVTETPEASESVGEPMDTNDEKPLTTEEKVERAKQIIEAKRELKQHEEEEAERAKELERRKMGQEVQKMRRQQQEDELKQMRDEILREKQEQLARRQKILAQIEQDKEERAKKFSQPVPEPSTAPSTKPPEVKPPTNRDTARLQFRLADGTSHTHDFPSSSTLEQIREYVRNNLNLPYRNFDLSTTFPRRQFTHEENSRTLIDLELVPNAVILVVPVTSTAVTQAPPGSGVISVVFWFFVSPLLGIFNYVRNFFGNRPTSSEPAPTQANNTVKRPNEPSPGSSSNGPSMPKRRIPPDSTVIRRQGNIHRLADRRDESDDENNTWNGNSTQQM